MNKYSKMKVRDLKDELKKKKGKLTGTKEKLIER